MRSSSTGMSIFRLPLVCCCALTAFFALPRAAAFGGAMLPFVQDIAAHTAAALHLSSPAFLPTLADFHHAASVTSSAASSSSISTAFLPLASSALAKTAASPADLAASALAGYRSALDAHPLRVKIVTGCVLAVAGDAIAQARRPGENNTYDTKRAAAFVAFDGCWRAVQQLAYPPLIRACHGQYLLGALGTLPFVRVQDQDPLLYAAMEQTLVSQLVMIPLLYYPVFYCITGAVQGLTVEETISRARDTFVPLMKRNLLFWIPVQFGTFEYVEENLQIPILILCGLVWTVILSVSAGSVTAPIGGDEEVAFSSAAIEANMRDMGAAEAAVGLNGTSFYFASDVSACSDDDDDGDAGEGSIRTICNVANLRSSELQEEQEAPHR